MRMISNDNDMNLQSATKCSKPKKKKKTQMSRLFSVTTLHNGVSVIGLAVTPEDVACGVSVMMNNEWSGSTG